LYCILLSAIVPSGLGCVDGPLFHLKKLNPIIQREWKEDRERGPVYSQRLNEFRLLKTTIKRMPQSEQQDWVNKVNAIVAKETSPELRREAVLVLNEVISNPDASSTIVRLAQDKNDKVRLAVAQSLRNHVTPETTQALLAMATSDKEANIRLAATASLGPHKTDEVKQFLSKQLNEPSPAVQYQSSLALKEQTGKDFGGDMSKWKRFMAGEEVTEEPVSLADSLRSYVPFMR
jgi:hypothetical protein